MNAAGDLSKTEAEDGIVIRNRQPGDLGYIAYRHGVLYSREYALDQIFETYVLESLLAHEKSSQGGHIWIAECDGRIAGFIAIIGINTETAQLRWFLIEPEFRGRGLGRRLMDSAIAYCRCKEYRQVFLWTFHGLDAACHLYETYGFELTEQVPNDTWKPGTLEERWQLNFR